ncbi:hypothetical protein ACP70R_005729 [Stipagrostis hirtigluma subsp. patula]
MDRLPLIAAARAPPPPGGRVLDAYKKALATAASAAAYAVLARSMARELLPDELRDAVRWAAALVRARFGRGEEEKERRRHTIVIRRQYDSDPRAMSRLCLARSRVHDPDGCGGGRSSWSTLLCLEPGDSATDVFDGVEFTWTSVRDGGAEEGKKGKGVDSLELSFDAEHTAMALDRYVPFVLSTAEDMQRRDQPLRIFMNEGTMWHGINHHHPATFDTLAMDPELKQSIVADLDRFLKRKEYYRRIGKAWKRGYLLYGPPGTGKSSLVAAMANYLRFNLYDLDLSEVRFNSELQRLLIAMPNKSILVIEDIDCCLDAASREDGKDGEAAGPNEVHLDPGYHSSFTGQNYRGPPGTMYHPGASPTHGITLSGLLNFIDGLWSTSGEERIIVFTTNYKDRLDPALLRPGRMDVHVYMGYCGWEAFKTLAKNYFLINDHALFPKIQELLAEAEVTPAEVSEMLLRSEDVDVALRGLAEFLEQKRRRTETEDKNE